MDKPQLICESLTIPHAAFEEAVRRIEQSFLFAEHKVEAEALGIIGESGCGKTTVLKDFYGRHSPSRSQSGKEVPVLFATVPANPSVKSLAAVLLTALEDPRSSYGTENQMTETIKTLMRQTGTRMVMIDEFQHFQDRGNHKIAHSVADWLKIVIDSTRTSLVIAGLPTCMAVIDQNEQLTRRFSAPVQLKRFDWTMPDDRKQFRKILITYRDAMSNRYSIPDLNSRDMAFRFWVATGGLITYVAKIMKQAERTALLCSNSGISLSDLHNAHVQSVWAAHRINELPRPFLEDFNTGETVDLLNRANQIGRAIEQPEAKVRRKTSRSVRESIDSMLVAG
jgi:ABC-type dipeptide/oligopeptide/nickel transport system ATPase subunit